jgi:hypothetical protein
MKNEIKKISLKPFKSAQKAIMEEIYIPKAFNKLITIDESSKESNESQKLEKKNKI